MKRLKKETFKLEVRIIPNCIEFLDIDSEFCYYPDIRPADSSKEG